jgi:hypothetical protein
MAVITISESRLEPTKLVYLALSKCGNDLKLMNGYIAYQANIDSIHVNVSTYSMTSSPTGPCTLKVTVPLSAAQALVARQSNGTLILGVGISISYADYAEPTKVVYLTLSKCPAPDDIEKLKGDIVHIAAPPSIDTGRVIVSTYSTASPTVPCTLNVTLPENAAELLVGKYNKDRTLALPSLQVGGISITNASDVEPTKVVYLTMSQCPALDEKLKGDIAHIAAPPSIDAGRVIVSTYSTASPTVPCTLKVTLPQKAAELLVGKYNKDGTPTLPLLHVGGISIAGMSYDAPTPSPTPAPTTCGSANNCPCKPIGDCSGHGTCNGITATCRCNGGWVGESCERWVFRARVTGTMSEFSSQPALIADFGIGEKKCPINLTCLAKGGKNATLTLDVADIDAAPTSDVTCTVKCNPSDQCATENAEGKVVLKMGTRVATTQLVAIVDYVDEGNQKVDVTIVGCSSTDPRFSFALWQGPAANLSSMLAPSRFAPFKCTRWGCVVYPAHLRTGLWRAASVENYPYPFVLDWNNANQSKTKSITLVGEPVILKGSNFDKVKSVCVDDVDVAMPPLWRVSVKLNGTTIVPQDAQDPGRRRADDEAASTTAGQPYARHFEVHLLDPDAKQWFKNATGEEYVPATYRGTCKRDATKLGPKRRRASDSSKFKIKPYNASTANLTFAFVVLGVPSDQYRQIPNGTFLNEVRACQWGRRLSGHALSCAVIVAGTERQQRVLAVRIPGQNWQRDRECDCEFDPLAVQSPAVQLLSI